MQQLLLNQQKIMSKTVNMLHSLIKNTELLPPYFLKRMKTKETLKNKITKFITNAKIA